MQNYLNDMKVSIEELHMEIETGNDIVNTIIYDIMSKNKEKNIRFKWVGLLPDGLIISSMDLCIIFSNLLLNAVEGVGRISSNDIKVIETRIKRFENSILIYIENPVAQRVNIVNNKLVTAKANKDEHGFGSLNIEECVKKYNGSVEYNSTEGKFTVEIIFHNIIYKI